MKVVSRYSLKWIGLTEIIFVHHHHRRHRHRHRRHHRHYH